MKKEKEFYVLYNKTTDEFFNGVKSKYVRWTKDFTMAKPLKKNGELTDRDKNYLKWYFENNELEITKAKYTFEW